MRLSPPRPPLADAATGGAADAKAVTEKALEDAAFSWPARCPFISRKPAIWTRRGKVDVSKVGDCPTT